MDLHIDEQFHQARAERVATDPLMTAWVALKNLEEPFTPEQAALIYDEAPRNGCALVLVDHPDLKAGSACLVKVGGHDPVAALIAWKKPLDRKIVHVGLQYLE